jgi:hypothetical protein
VKFGAEGAGANMHKADVAEKLLEELKLYIVELITDVIEYSNLADLKTINEFLIESGFLTKREQKEREK